MQTYKENTFFNKSALLLLCPYCKSEIPDIQLRPITGNINILIICSCLPEYKLIPLSEFMSLIKTMTHIKKGCTDHLNSNLEETLYCLQCQNWLCSFCLVHHSFLFKKHTLIPIEFHTQCSIHHNDLLYYCNKCHYDICPQCISFHESHELLNNSQIDISEFKEAYVKNIKLKMIKNDELNRKFNDITTKAILLNEEKEVNLDMSNSINSLYLINKFTNQLLQELIEAFFNTVELINNHYNHHIEKLANSIQLNLSTIQLSNNYSDSTYLSLKEYYLNSFIVKQCDINSSNKYSLSTLIHELKGHNYITALTELDCNQFASGSKDNTIKLWNSNTYDCISTLSGHKDIVSSRIQFNGNILISSSWDNTIKVWDLNTYNCIFTLKENLYISCLLKLTEDLLVSVSWNVFKIWSISTLQLLSRFQGHSNFINCMININSSTFATGSWDKTVKIWDAKSLKCISTLIGHDDLVYCIVKVNDHLLASGSRDKTIKLWDSHSYECVSTLKGSSAVVSLALFDNSIIVSGSYDGSITLWDYKESKLISTIFLSNKTQSSIKCLLYLKNNKLVCGEDGIKITSINN